ncbi:hypothetical protein DFJ66_6175 [Saccharothrix variisporea]|uniref:Uncharacterized protein n=2 Tax=Saccharothrix variisporea TaxID=543527 RepID=A0A495XEG0_9PSEU|nr:hypothetical protein DFJ66_6175 [Saccharothrix variisporea]
MVMASLFSKLSAFARSPQGRRITEQIKHAARDPHTRAKAQEMLRKLRSKRHGR